MADQHEQQPDQQQPFLDTWNPEPLVPDLDVEQYQYALNPHVVTSKPGKFITIDGKECLNMGTHNYLGLADNLALEKEAIESSRKYGVGSCGPRAFYGTMDVHLKLEEELANFLDVQEVILYSYGFSTIASAIPAYVKTNDVVFVDEYCNFAIQQGLIASRCRIITFKHNDMDDLVKKVEGYLEEHRKSNGKAKKNRTFLIVEGIYIRTGDICPLNELINIKKQYKIRLFIDESCSFGVLGPSGKGITQHFNINIGDVDMIMASLENATCAYGGFCAGSSYVVDHQRLAGSGYCFSASLPPLQVQTALTSLNLIRNDPTIVTKPLELYFYAQDKLEELTHLTNISQPMSPVKVLKIKKESSPDDYKEDQLILDKICQSVLNDENIAITVARYLEDEELIKPDASIRLIINAHLTRRDIDRVVIALNRFSQMTI